MLLSLRCSCAAIVCMLCTCTLRAQTIVRKQLMLAQFETRSISRVDIREINLAPAKFVLNYLMDKEKDFIILLDDKEQPVNP
jgi:hypothetical protein